MIKTAKLIVSFRFENKDILIGELITENRKIFFRYDSTFLKSGLEISPFKLPLSEQIYSANESPFDGLFGVFADSLPDGWGKLLVDRTLIKKGISIAQISPLDRLSIVGKTGMGALHYQPAEESDSTTSLRFDLDEMRKEINHILDGTNSELLDELFQMGGSSVGARPKILIGHNSKTKKFMHSENELPNGFEHWLIKFPSVYDTKDIANIEFAYATMAVDAGIEMSECKLFKSKSGKCYFGTKRFDRIGNTKLHLHSAAGLLNDNFRLSNLDYGHLMDAAFRLEKNVSAYEKIVRIAAFNVFTHNRDDHSKNISFLMDAKGIWKLAPAYDLTFSNSSHGYHSTMVYGESKNPGKSHLLKLADNFRLKKAKLIIEEVESVVMNWKKYAKECGVGKEMTTIISKTILK